MNSKDTSSNELNKLITKYARTAIQYKNLNYFTGKVIAIDAVLVILEFKRSLNLHDKNGNVTSHLKGLFNRTIGFLEAGIKPIYVFDGKLPDSRKGSKKDYQIKPCYEQECNDAKRLLGLMGVPYVVAKCEAGALCSDMVESRFAYCTASSFMNAFPFGNNILLRNLKIDKHQMIELINRNDVLTTLELNEDQFIDVCVLLGFYCDKIPGFGFQTVFNKIKEHGSGENIFLNDRRFRNNKPENFDKACDDLKNPTSDTFNGDAKWGAIQEEELIKFLCNERNFNADIIGKSIQARKN